jgi:hypothetical protein
MGPLVRSGSTTHHTAPVVVDDLVRRYREQHPTARDAFEDVLTEVSQGVIAGTEKVGDGAGDHDLTGAGN